MQKPNRRREEIEKQHKDEINTAIALIQRILGQRVELSAQSPDVVFQFLSFLLLCQKYQRQDLLVEHDLTHEMSESELAMLWKFVNGKTKDISKKKDKSKFGSMTFKAHEFIKFMMARRGDNEFLRSTGVLGLRTSSNDKALSENKPKINGLGTMVMSGIVSNLSKGMDGIANQR